MLRIMCQTPDTVLLGELTPFQGNLKKRTGRDMKALEESIQSDGLLMPFVVWRCGNVNFLLDGHGRLEAIGAMALKDTEIASQRLPVIYIDADTEEQARKMLLQITSSYGKVTKEGALKFCSTIPSYHAPAINRFMHRKPVQRKASSVPGATLLRIRVASDKVQAVLELFKTVSYIEVL